MFCKAGSDGTSDDEYVYAVKRFRNDLSRKAVEEGIINEVGGMKEALAKLHQMIDAGIK